MANVRRAVSSALFTGFLVGIAFAPSANAQPVPVSYVSRAEAALLVLRHSGIEVKNPINTFGVYPDIVDSEWSTPYMVKAVQLSMLQPSETTNMLFPHRSLSRAEFLKMIAIAFELPQNLPHRYVDVPPSAWFKSYAGIGFKYQLFPNDANPLLMMPNLRITHEEAARALYVLLTAEPSLKKGNDIFFARDLPQGTVDESVQFAAPEEPAAEPEPQPEPEPEPVFVPEPEPVPVFVPEPVPVYTSFSPPPQYLGTTPKQDPEPVSLYVSQSTPAVVKTAVLQLVRSQGNGAAKVKNEIIQLVNAERSKYSLPPLRENYYLELAAQKHAKDMYDRGYFSHFTPEGKNYVDRIRSAGYLDINPAACSCAQQFNLGDNFENITEVGPNYLVIGTEKCTCTPIYSLGENIARGQLSAKEVMEDWIASPSHRENIVRSSFQEIGIGLFGDVWVQEFGKLDFE